MRRTRSRQAGLAILVLAALLLATSCASSSKSSARSSECVARDIPSAAKCFATTTEIGQRIGTIDVPAIGVEAPIIDGTDPSALARGTGRYQQSSFPGLGKVVAIAGHRTTFGAVFRRIDTLKQGDKVVLTMPYGTFTYRVFAHEIVKATDWSILRRRPFETLVLSSCHPLYSASHRWIVYARLSKEKRKS
jgi:sortase A